MILSERLARWSAQAGGPVLVVIVLVITAMSLIAVVGSNLETSADMRKESQEAYFLGEMQIAVTRVEESVAAWRLDPTGNVHPSVDPAIAVATAEFRHWADQLVALIDEDEIAVVDGFRAAFGNYLDAVGLLQMESSQDQWVELAALDLAVRAPLLDLLVEESAHLLDSVNADRRSEQYLRWGLPVLLALAVALLFFVVRLQNRSRELDEQRRLNEARSEFIASISHELRTPLTPVVAYANELRDGLDRFTPEEVTEFIDVIAREGEEAGAIVDDLLVAARLEINELNVVAEPLAIADQVEHALASLGMTEQVEVDVEGAVLADAGRLRQILRNLVGNAQRYGGNRISLTSRLQGDVVLISVSDSGEGIPDELQAHVFEPFVTAGKDEGLPPSVGLGLTISRRLATLMGGSLTYRWANGWSTLELRLPAAAASEVKLPA